MMSDGLAGLMILGGYCLGVAITFRILVGINNSAVRRGKPDEVIYGGSLTFLSCAWPILLIFSPILAVTNLGDWVDRYISKPQADAARRREKALGEAEKMLNGKTERGLG